MLLTKAKKQLKDEVAIARGFSQINSLPFVLSQIFAIGKWLEEFSTKVNQQFVFSIRKTTLTRTKWSINRLKAKKYEKYENWLRYGSYHDLDQNIEIWLGKKRIDASNCCSAASMFSGIKGACSLRRSPPQTSEQEHHADPRTQLLLWKWCVVRGGPWREAPWLPSIEKPSECCITKLKTRAHGARKRKSWIAHGHSGAPVVGSVETKSLEESRVHFRIRYLVRTSTNISRRRFTEPILSSLTAESESPVRGPVVAPNNFGTPGKTSARTRD